jgi:FtsH-binding integral membrane protein
MRYVQRVTLGIVLIVISFVVLWVGSPDRTGPDPNTAAALAFVGLFAVGFIIGAMGLMGAESDYPSLLSGLVLYLIVGALVAVYLYTSSTQLGRITLQDADNPTFWTYWIRVAVTWPLEIARHFDVFGWDSFYYT